MKNLRVVASGHHATRPSSGQIASLRCVFGAAVVCFSAMVAAQPLPVPPECVQLRELMKSHSRAPAGGLSRACREAQVRQGREARANAAARAAQPSPPAAQPPPIQQPTPARPMVAPPTAATAPQQQEVFEDLSPNASRKRMADARGPQGLMSVFGITLGEPLKVGSCETPTLPLSVGDLMRYNAEIQALSNGGSPAVLIDTCRWHPSLMDAGHSGGALAQHISGISINSPPPGVELVMVRLGVEGCPDWVRAAGACALSVTTKDGLVTGVAFLSGGADLADGIEQGLTAKYGTPSAPRAQAMCQSLPNPGRRPITGKGFIRRWETKGLIVRYYSMAGPSCTQGRVSVQTQALHDSLIQTGQINEINETSQPKM
jgi:hypothetical protein